MEVISKYGFQFILSSNGGYEVKRLRKLIDSKLITSTGPVICWNKEIPLKVRCFVWRAMLGRIPVAETLALRGVNSMSQMCPLCNLELETVNHLLVNCEFKHAVQYWIFRWCGIQPGRFSCSKEFIEGTHLWGNCPKKRLIGNTILFCLLWNVWIYRNEKVFKQMNTSATKVVDNIIPQSFAWCKHRSSFGCGD